MKKRLLLGLVMALVLSISFALPVAASNIVSMEKDQDTVVDYYVYDDGTSHYEGTIVVHISSLVVHYADGTVKFDFQNVQMGELRGYGVYGNKVSVKSRYLEIWTDNAVNGPVEHTMDVSLVNGLGYRLVYTYANGEVRVAIYNEY